MEKIYHKWTRFHMPQPQLRSNLHGFLPETLNSYLKDLGSIRSGSRFSRVFRHAFEYKHAKRVLGSNLALLVLASSFVPTVSSFNPDQYELNVYESSNAQIITNVTVRKPLKYLYVNQGYHVFHLGIDFEGVTGDPIYPIMDGVVESVEFSGYAYGNSVVVDHQNGYKSRYAHMSKIDVKKGQNIDVFVKLGGVGSTGRSSGDHLHIEVTQNGRSLNPLNIIPRD